MEDLSRRMKTATTMLSTTFWRLVSAPTFLTERLSPNCNISGLWMTEKDKRRGQMLAKEGLLRWERFRTTTQLQQRFEPPRPFWILLPLGHVLSGRLDSRCPGKLKCGV